ncbi:hypothetical protein DIPPA_27719 [Diplonema papillatum]|nr:hypothetical protein DIPPA_27719 [Diplonema papillatum]
MYRARGVCAQRRVAQISLCLSVCRPRQHGSVSTGENVPFWRVDRKEVKRRNDVALDALRTSRSCAEVLQAVGNADLRGTLQLVAAVRALGDLLRSGDIGCTDDAGLRNLFRALEGKLKYAEESIDDKLLLLLGRHLGHVSTSFWHHVGPLTELVASSVLERGLLHAAFAACTDPKTYTTSKETRGFCMDDCARLIARFATVASRFHPDSTVFHLNSAPGDQFPVACRFLSEVSSLYEDYLRMHTAAEGKRGRHRSRGLRPLSHDAENPLIIALASANQLAGEHVPLLVERAAVRGASELSGRCLVVLVSVAGGKAASCSMQLPAELPGGVRQQCLNLVAEEVCARGDLLFSQRQVTVLSRSCAALRQLPAGLQQVLVANILRLTWTAFSPHQMASLCANFTQLSVLLGSAGILLRRLEYDLRQTSLFRPEPTLSRAKEMKFVAVVVHAFASSSVSSKEVFDTARERLEAGPTDEVDLISLTSLMRSLSMVGNRSPVETVSLLLRLTLERLLQDGTTHKKMGLVLVHLTWTVLHAHQDVALPNWSTTASRQLCQSYESLLMKQSATTILPPAELVLCMRAFATAGFTPHRFAEAVDEYFFTHGVSTVLRNHEYSELRSAFVALELPAPKFYLSGEVNMHESMGSAVPGKHNPQIGYASSERIY